MNLNYIKNAATFAEHVNALQEQFPQIYSWTEKSKARLITFLVDALAGQTEVNQGYIMIAMREAFMRRARRSSSILANAQNLGIDLYRKTGSTVSATLRNNAGFTKSIARFDQFLIDELPFYAVESINIPAQSNRTIVLRQGERRTKTFELTTVDLDFPEFTIGEPGFVVSEDDLEVYVEDPSSGVVTEFTSLTTTLFEATTEDVYIERTTEEGDVALLFGNGVFGNRLNATHRVIVSYILTSGASGNVGTPAARIRYDTDRDITGQTNESATGGSNEQDPDTLRMYSTYQFESHGALIREDHWQALVNYPDVADIEIQSQRDIDPEDIRWMGVVRICVLPVNSSSWGGTNPNPQSSQWTSFLNHIQPLKFNNLIVQPYNPEKLLTEVVIEAYIFDDQSKAEWESRINKALSEFFRRRQGTLGRKLEPGDLADVCKIDANGVRYPGLDYVRVLKPLVPVEPRSRLEYVTPSSVSISVKYTERKER
jgi:hypothetical protein